MLHQRHVSAVEGSLLASTGPFLVPAEGKQMAAFTGNISGARCGPLMTLLGLGGKDKALFGRDGDEEEVSERASRTY
jgi:hypothetical protein